MGRILFAALVAVWLSSPFACARMGLRVRTGLDQPASTVSIVNNAGTTIAAGRDRRKYTSDFVDSLDAVGNALHADDTYVIRVDRGCTLDGSRTFGANVYFEFEPGSEIIISDGQTLTINSPTNLLCPERQKVFTSLGTGAVTFACGGTVYPGWWGAMGDGRMDDAMAFRAARDAVGLGGRVFVPPGTYLFCQPIDPGDYVTWEGMGLGSVLKCSSANRQAVFKTNGSGIGLDTFKNLTFRSANPDANAFDIDPRYYINKCVFDNLHIYAEFNTGIRGMFGNCSFLNSMFGYLGVPGSIFRPIIDDSRSNAAQSLANDYRSCFFRQARGGRAAVQLGFGNTQRFENCIWETCSVPAIDANGVWDVTLDNCNFEDMEPGGASNCLVTMNYNAAAKVGTQCHFISCRFTNNGKVKWDAVAYAGGSACMAGFANCNGGLTSAYWCKDGFGTYDTAQITARGLMYAINNHVTGYSGLTGGYYLRFSSPIFQGTDPALYLMGLNPADTRYWLGINADEDGLDNDAFEIGTGTKKGCNVQWRIAEGILFTNSHYPLEDGTCYLGKNDDDSPAAWKGVILKDTANGKYYRIEITNGLLTAVDLTD